jgi:hypothetical protein
VLAFVNGKKLEQFDVEIIANVVRALVNHPDVVSDLQYYKVLQLLEILSAGDVYVHQPYDLNVTNIIFEAYGNA